MGKKRNAVGGTALLDPASEEWRLSRRSSAKGAPRERSGKPAVRGTTAADGNAERAPAPAAAAAASAALMGQPVGCVWTTTEAMQQPDIDLVANDDFTIRRRPDGSLRVEDDGTVWRLAWVKTLRSGRPCVTPVRVTEVDMFDNSLEDWHNGTLYLNASFAEHRCNDVGGGEDDLSDDFALPASPKHGLEPSGFGPHAAAEPETDDEASPKDACELAEQLAEQAEKKRAKLGNKPPPPNPPFGPDASLTSISPCFICGEGKFDTWMSFVRHCRKHHGHQQSDWRRCENKIVHERIIEEQKLARDSKAKRPP